MPDGALADEDDLAQMKIELKEGDKIICFGDSRTARSARAVPKEHVKKGYVRIVRETLQKKHQYKNLEVEGSGACAAPKVLCATCDRRQQQVRRRKASQLQISIRFLDSHFGWTEKRGTVHLLYALAESVL